MFGVTGCSAQSAGACVAPEATASPATGAPAQSITIDGQYWQPCNDTNYSTEGPWPSASIEYVQSDEVVPLGTIPIEDGAFSAEVEIPARASPGDAVLLISAGYSQRELPITISAP
jgi:hypothetical protein